MISEESELRNDYDERIGALTCEINDLISELGETPYVYQGPDTLMQKASFSIYSQLSIDSAKITIFGGLF